MQPLSRPPTERELAQVLDPDGAGHGVRLERAGSETTAHPTGQFGPVVVTFLGLVCLTIASVAGVHVVQRWQANDVIEAVFAAGTLVTLPPVFWLIVRVLRWLDRFALVHGPFARWDHVAGTIDLPRLGVTLHRQQLVEVVCLTGGEWWGGWIRVGASCPLAAVLPEGAIRHNSGWAAVNELSVIAETPDGSLARYPVVTAQNPWRFRERAEQFAADFGLPVRVIALTRAARRELRQTGWEHPGEFADADRPRKVAAGRVAVGDGLPVFGRVSLCRPAAGARNPAGPSNSFQELRRGG